MLCRIRPRKLLIPLTGQFHFMTEPTVVEQTTTTCLAIAET